MKNDKKNFTPIEGEFTDFDFEFVHKDKKEKIHDEKLKTKPTTFAKDALRRFAKNKASVVGATIIGILLLGSFLSFLSPYDISAPHGQYIRMLPKIREASDGWWDGTQRLEDKYFDEETGLPMTVDENGLPIDVDPKIVVPGSLQLGGMSFFDGDPIAYARGGYIHLKTDKPGQTVKFRNNEGKSAPKESGNGLSFSLSEDEDVSLSITFGGTRFLDGYELAGASIWLRGSKNLPGNSSKYDHEVLLNADPIISEDGEDVTFTVDNIGSYVASTGRSILHACKFDIEFSSSTANNAYALIKSLEFTVGDNVNEHTKKRLTDLSFDNANWTIKNTTMQINPEKYWRFNGLSPKIYHAFVHKCSYLYDQYADVFGERDSIIGQREIKKYIAQGWCTFDDWDDITTFHLTPKGLEECPILYIESIHYKPTEGSTVAFYDYNCRVVQYRYLGFKSMPYFIFGTDGNGHDILTKSLSCLKNSLLLAIITSAACLAIGLVWGSVSGYFGGNVDLFMERITDILSGVPWIVVMTLVMLLLGRTYITFGIAICLTGWISTASRTRTQFYRFKGREYVLASRTLGASDARLIFRHILPNGLGTIVTGSVLMIPSTIFSEATLSYLGLGLSSGDSFGVLLADNQANLTSRPALIILPSIIISLLMISFNLFGNGLRDALNPTLKGGEQ